MKLKNCSDEQLVAHIDKRIKQYVGTLDTLSNAIGYLMVSRKFGWKPMLLIHSIKSIKKYEEILDFDSREAFEPVGELARKSIAWIAVQKISNFWKAVKGEIPDIRSSELTK